MRNQTCCFSGHRHILKNEYEAIRKRLESELVRLINQGVHYFGAGGALGFDTLAALAVLKLREDFPHIAIPCLTCCLQAENANASTRSSAQQTVYVKRNCHIKLILVLPCQDQTRGWIEKDKSIHHLILKQADKVVYTSVEYFSGCMHTRNRHLVNCSSVCVCYLTNFRSGTGYTVAYARRQGLKVINLAQV